jgi:hypothetical protein
LHFRKVGDPGDFTAGIAEVDGAPATDDEFGKLILRKPTGASPTRLEFYDDQGGILVLGAGVSPFDWNDVLTNGRVSGGVSPQISNGDLLEFSRTNVLSVDAAAQAGDETVTLRDPGGPDFFVYEGLAQTLTNKTLTTPTIGDFSNATHTHENNAGGGALSAAAIQAGVLPIARGGTNTGSVPTNGQLLIGNGTDYTVAGLTATADQTTVTPGAGSITIGTVQDIGTGSTPTFTGLDVSNQNITQVATPTIGTHAANKDYVDSVAQGLEWQDSVIEIQTTPPGGPSTGDRYIVLPTGTGAWAGQDNNIAEWNGSSWDFTTSSEGFAAWNDTQDAGYVFNGTSWVTFSSTVNHSVLQNLGADDHTQYVRTDGTRATYTGQTSITTLGTIATGTWQADTVTEGFGGTNQTTYATGDLLYASGVNTLAKRTIGGAGAFLQPSAGVPVWTTAPTISDFTNANHTHASAGQGGLIALQQVYDNSTTTQPKILVTAANGALIIRDAATPIGDLLILEDNAGVDFLGVGPAALDYGIATNREFSLQTQADGKGIIEWMPDGRTFTNASPLGPMLTWTSSVVSNVPGGAPFGNDTAPAAIGFTGECRFDDPAFLFATSLLFNQGSTLTANGVNLGPVYTMVNQPTVRTGTLGGSRTTSQANAVRSQMRVGPNIAGDHTLVSHEPFFATIIVDATVGTVTATTVNYYAPKAPTLVAGGTIGTLNVLDIPAIPAAGIGTLRGINSALSAGTFINHTGTAPAIFGGEVEMNGALNHDGSTVGFFGVAPATQPSAYTPTNVTPDRAYDADATSVNELADILGTLIADLQSLGVVG